MKSPNWDISELRHVLKPLVPGIPNELSPVQKRYIHYYNINFAEQMDGVEHEIGSFEAADYTLAAHIYRHPEATGTALLVHGYYDHVGIYGSLIRFCLEQKWNVFAFDLPGHGLSTGERAAIGSFREYDEVFSAALSLCRDCVATDDSPLYLFGQSTGGAIIVNYLQTRNIRQEDCPFAGISLFAPLVRPVGWGHARILHSLLSPFLTQIKRTFATNSNDPEFLRFIAENDPLQPLALSVRWVGALKKWIGMIEASEESDLPINIVQGDHDGTVDWKHNMEILAEKFPHRQLLLIEGGRHHMVNEIREKRDSAYHWLAQQLHS